MSETIDLTVEQRKKKIWKALATVTDPEIPVLTIEEMGILRDVSLKGEQVFVYITPTYSGCPAIDAITADVKTVLAKIGYPQVEVKLVLTPAWTTDWMNNESKKKLLDYGIAPPCKTFEQAKLDEGIILNLSVKCPQCQSLNTKVISDFGSTACKALWKCNDCSEPFDYFKPL